MHNTAPQLQNADPAPRQLPPVELLGHRPTLGPSDESLGYGDDKEGTDVVRRAHRYTTDGNVYVHNLPGDVQLSSTIAGSLAGEGIAESHGTSGVGYASREIGRVISGQRPVESLYGYDATPPSKRTFEDMIKRNVGAEVGVMMTGLLMDATYGYTKQEGDGFVEVEAMDAESASRVKEYSNSYPAEAQFCAKTEWHFSKDTTRLQPVAVNGEVVALQKKDGAHTALLLKPVIINGVRIPVGSIMNVGSNDKGESTFAFGRLSPFCLTNPHEGVRQFPEVFNDRRSYGEDPYYRRGDVPVSYTYALDHFNTAAGRPSEPGAEQLLADYIKEYGDQYVDSMVAARELITQIDERVRDGATDALRGEVTTAGRISRALRKENATAIAAAKATARDKALSDAGRGDPGERHTLVAQTVRTRSMHYRLFGYQEVKQVERLVDLRDDLARIANRSVARR